MTRTERAQFPRAIAKDRHDSRTGLNTDPHHVPKHGEGKHSWGSDLRELDHEVDSFEDEVPLPVDEALERSTGDVASKPIPIRKVSVDVSEEDREKARALRTHALRDVSTLYSNCMSCMGMPDTDVSSHRHRPQLHR
jgi:hypothetical protein